MLGQIKTMANRTVWFYVILIVFGYFFLDHHKAISRARLMTLNRLMPPFAEFVDYAAQGKPLQNQEWGDYIHYLKHVDRYVPNLADAKFLLAFAYAQEGQREKAIELLEESIKLNPAFFWAHYNVGVLYFKAGRFAQAAEAFERSTRTRPDVAIKVIMSSHVYRPLVQHIDDPARTLVRDLRVGYRDASRLAVLSKLQQSRPDAAGEIQREVDALQDILTLRVF